MGTRSNGHNGKEAQGKGQSTRVNDHEETRVKEHKGKLYKSKDAKC